MTPSGELRGKINTAVLARTHFLEKSDSGLISIMGGKWTIYRKMGEDAVYAALDDLQAQGALSEAKLNQLKSRSTEHLKLLGDYRTLMRQPSTEEFDQKLDYKHYHESLVNQMIKKGGAFRDDIKMLNYLAYRFGVRAFDVLNIFEQDKKNRERFHKDFDLTRGEVLYFLQSEQVVSPMDILLRRSRLAFYDSQAALDIIPHIVDVFGDHYGWSNERKNNEYKVCAELFNNMKFLNIAPLIDELNNPDLINQAQKKD